MRIVTGIDGKSLARAVTIGTMILGLMMAPQVIAQSSQAASAPSTVQGPISYDVVSIKPDHASDIGTHIHVSEDRDSFLATGVTAKYLIELAYEVRDFQISGGPSWADSEKYPINAKIDADTVEALKKLPREQGSGRRQLMLQSLLVERFKLKLSHSSKELPIYALAVAKNGPKLSQAANPAGPSGSSSNKRGEVTITGMPMSSFADWLSRQLGRKVVDKTGLQGKYDFSLRWSPERLTPIGGNAANANAATPSPDSSGVSIFTALQEQLGLKLESQKGPVEILVIDSIERPSEN